jgi:hypothetical protein
MAESKTEHRLFPQKTVSAHAYAHVADHLGLADAGRAEVAVAGMGGVAIAGTDGVAIARQKGTTLVGDFGLAASGPRGIAQAGNTGIAIAGLGGTAEAGHNSLIIIAYHDGTMIRYRVGKTKDADGSGGPLEPDVRYGLNAEHEFEPTPDRPILAVDRGEGAK